MTSAQSPLWFLSHDEKIQVVGRYAGKRVKVRYSTDGSRTKYTEVRGWVQPWKVSRPYTFIVTIKNTDKRQEHRAVLFSRLMDIQELAWPPTEGEQ